MPVGIVETAIVLGVARRARGHLIKQKRRKRRRDFFTNQRSSIKKHSAIKLVEPLEE